MAAIDTITKLKALLNTSGRTEHEADTAQKLAAAIATKEGIDLESIGTAEDQARIAITHKTVGEWAKIPAEATYASLVCQKHFDVTTLEKGGLFADGMIFIGTAHHIEVAAYVFEFLCGEFRRAWNRRQTKSRSRKAFMWGAFLALSAKLEKRGADGAATGALVLSLKSKRDAYLKDKFPSSTNKSVNPQARRSIAMSHGFRAGRDIEIRPGVNGAPENHQGRLALATPRLLLGN